MRTKIAAAALALLALAAAARAQAGPEFQVNSTTTLAQRVPVVAATPSGSFVVAWESFSITAGTDYDIFFQRFDNTGAKIGSETQVNTYTSLNQSQPSIASDSAGNFVVVWTDMNVEDGSNFGVFGRRYDSSGSPLGGEFQVNTYTTGYQYHPAIAMTPAGNFVVVWQSYPGQDGSSIGVFGRRYDSSGNALGGEFPVNTYTTNQQKQPRVAVDSTGNFTVVWNSVSQDSNGGGIFARRYDSAGNPLGGEFQVNTYTTNAQYLPDVAIDPSGNSIFVWTSYGQDGASAGVFARRFDSAGNPLSGELNVNTFTAFNQNHPRVAVGPSGEFVVVWQSYGQDDPTDPTSTAVLAQAFDNTGKRRSGELPINEYTTDHQQLPSIAGDGRGQFVITWESQGQDLAGYAVEARLGGFPAGQPMKVDQRVSGGTSNVNGVLEVGERVTVDTAYGNRGASSLPLSGAASNFAGPTGGIYTLDDAAADYGSIAASGLANCFDATGNCYEVTVGGTRPAQHWDAHFDETLNYHGFGKRWSLHVGGSFPDVPQNGFYPFIENLFHNGVTGGCGGGGYCPASNVTRAQMAVFLLKSKYGAEYKPPPATGTVFTDVPASNPFAAWIENLFALGITGGCGAGIYCPNNPVTRQQMAVFLLKTKYGSTYAPPDGTGLFGDVTCPSVVCNFIEELFHEGITGGCQTNPVLLYCPSSPNLRQQMAVFLVKAFGLELYGP